jgi:hypothetical protein
MSRCLITLIEPPVEPAEQVIEAQCRHTTRCQLDRDTQSIEFATQARHRRGDVVGQFEAVVASAGAVVEERT